MINVHQINSMATRKSWKSSAIYQVQLAHISSKENQFWTILVTEYLLPLHWHICKLWIWVIINILIPLEAQRRDSTHDVQLRGQFLKGRREDLPTMIWFSDLLEPAENF